MKISRLEPWIVILALLATMFLNMAAFVYRSYVTPQEKVFAGTQFYSDDYAVYVSYIKQGQQGRWTTVDKFTSEPHPSSLIHEEYLLWGKLTGLLGIPPILSYHLARMIWGIVFLLTLYGLLSHLFPRKEEAALRIGSFLLATLSAGFFEKIGQQKELYLSWLTDLDPTQRFGPVPHYLLGFICLLIILAVFYSILNQSEKKLVKPLSIIAIAGLIGGFILPSSLVIAVSILAIFSFGNFLAMSFTKKNEYWQNIRFSVLVVLVLFLVNLPSLVYYQQIFKVSPWSHILAWERFNRGNFTLSQYFLALGPIAFLAPLGLLALKNKLLRPKVRSRSKSSTKFVSLPAGRQVARYRELQNKTRLVLFVTAWLATVLLWSFWLADLVGLNPTRFLQALVYIPMAVLTILGLNQIATWLLRGKSRLKTSSPCLIAVVVLIILIGLPTIKVSLKNQFKMYSDFSGLIYPEDYLVEAYHFLETKTKPEEVVLVLYQSGNLIPFMGGNTTFLGHLQETINFSGKVGAAAQFYSGSLNEKQAKDFLTQNRISLVFYSPQEKSAGGNIKEYSFLQPIFENQMVTIFRVTE